MSEMVERVAQAIYEGPDRDIYLTPWPELREKDRDHFIAVARSAIQAMREPTEQMVFAADWQERGTYAAWRAMIDAAIATP